MLRMTTRILRIAPNGGLTLLGGAVFLGTATQDAFWRRTDPSYEMTNKSLPWR